MTVGIRLKVNGREISAQVEPRRILADFLREDLGLTGTHLGCEHGVCGACTVLIDGQSARSCLMFAAQADGCEILTVEGLAGDGQWHPIQHAFSQQHGLQCGFCTPGMMLAALELLQENPNPDEQQIREHMSGNICRCTGYVFIVKSIQAAAAQMRKEA